MRPTFYSTTSVRLLCALLLAMSLSNTATPQKPTTRIARRWISSLLAGWLLALPYWVNAGGAVDLNRFNVQSCVSDDVREATAQKYLKAVDEPQYPRQFLENLNYALKHDWLLQEDFYTVDNIRRLLGVSEVHISCVDTNQFLPSFSAYGAMYREQIADVPVVNHEVHTGFFDRAGWGTSVGSLSHLQGHRMKGIISFGFAESMDIDYIEMTFGRFLSTSEFLASPLAKELGVYTRDRHGTRYIDLSDEYVWRYVGVYYANLDSRNQRIFIGSRQRKQP